MVQNELHHYRLDSNFHEGCCAAEAGGFNLFWPETTRENGKTEVKFSLTQLKKIGIWVKPFWDEFPTCDGCLNPSIQAEWLIIKNRQSVLCVANIRNQASLRTQSVWHQKEQQLLFLILEIKKLIRGILKSPASWANVQMKSYNSFNTMKESRMSSHLSRLGAHTMARFLLCMLVM